MTKDEGLMNSRDRILCALGRGVPDRVPHMELIIDKKVINAISPGVAAEDFMERMGLDAITAPVEYTYEPLTSDGRTVRDEWGIIRRYGAEAVAMPVEGPLKNAADVAHLRCPDIKAPHRFRQLRSMVDRFKGRLAIGVRAYDAMYYPSYLRGMENYLTDVYDNPDELRRLVQITVDYHAELAREAIALGADFVVLGDDYASRQAPMISPAHFRELVQPGLAKVVSAIKAAGAYCFKHTDGYIEPILDMIVETGIDALHPLERISGMDLVAVKRRYGDRICVAGSVDCSALLSFGTPQQVAEETLYYLREAAPGGGFILMSSNTIHSGVKPENYLAMLETVRTHGAYPIKV